nr:LpqB family beta-propeller domain-containing protein [Phytoactinopolyspora alkaliphila]
MEQVDGEWRIAEPPQGTIISEDNFAREYESHNLCFYNLDGEMFVYDPVYVPKSGQTATLLTQMLLAGPSEWLDPAVRTAFPEATTLSVASVPIDSGTATVDLSDAAAENTDAAQRSRMAVQLGCTLSGLPEVSRVAMNTDGIALLGQDESTIDAVVLERHDPNLLGAGGALYAIREGSLVRGDGDAPQPVQGALGVAEDLTEVAVDAGGGRAVVVAGFGTELQTAAVDSDSRRTILEGAGFTSPSWARNNVIWAVGQADSGGRLVAMTPEGAEIEVRAADLDQRDVQRVDVSPDGTRMALVVDGIAYLALVVVDGEARDHVSVERLRRIGPDSDALDVAWSGSERVALLVGDEEADPEVLVVDTFGAVQASRGTVVGAVFVAAGADQRLVVATEDGMLVEHESRTRWIELGEGGAPAYP